MTESADDRPTIAPFLGALVIFVAVVIGVLLVRLFSDSGPSAEAQITHAAVGQNDALQRQDYADYRSFTCLEQQGTEAEIIDRQRESVEKLGERYLDDITDVKVDGDRATAKVTYHFDKAPDDKQDVETVFVLQDGAWKVCSDQPG